MRIPAGSFGLTSAPIASAPDVPREAFVGTGVRQLASDISAVTDAQDAVDRQRANEVNQTARQEAKRVESEARDTASLKAHSQATRDLSTAATEIHQGIVEGTISKVDAYEHWRARAQGAIDGALPIIAPAHQELYKAQMSSVVNKFDAHVLDAVTQRNRLDIHADLLATRENYQRQAQAGDVDGAIRDWKTVLAAKGPLANMTPVDIQRDGQAFSEETRYTKAFSMIDATPDSVPGLKAMQRTLAGKEFGDLDPQKRAALDHTLRSRIEITERRAAVQAETQARKLDREFQAFATFLDKGVAPSAEYAGQVATRFKGTVYDKPAQEMLRGTPENAGFASLPLPKQSALLNQMLSERNANGADPRAVARYEKLDRINKQTLADIKEDPFKAALERGVIKEAAPLELDIATLPAQLAARREQADTISTWTGKTASPFRPDEAKWLAHTIEQLPVDQRATWLGQLGKEVGGPKQMLALAEQMGAKSPTIATAAYLSAKNLRTTAGRSLAEIYLKGDDAIKEGTAKIDKAAETGIRAQIYGELEGVYATPAARDMAADVALKVYGQLKHEGHESVGGAIDLATGGITKFNGAKVPKPYGWSDGEFRDAATKVTPDDVRRFAGGDAVIVGNQQLTAAQFAAQIPGARLRSYGDNVYTVQLGSFLAQRQNGAPLTLTLTRPNVR